MPASNKEQLQNVWVYTCDVDHGFFAMGKKRALGLQNWDGTIECPCGKPIRQEDWSAQGGVTHITAEDSQEGNEK